MKLTIKQLKQLIKEQIAGMDIDSVDHAAMAQQRERDRIQDEEVKNFNELHAALAALIDKFGMDEVRDTILNF